MKARRNVWMAAFEAESERAGMPYEAMHGPGHEAFWDSAQYYFTQGVQPREAAQLHFVVWKNRDTKEGAQ